MERETLADPDPSARADASGRTDARPPCSVRTPVSRAARAIGGRPARYFEDFAASS